MMTIPLPFVFFETHEGAARCTVQRVDPSKDNAL
jgi:hypothetical protein